MKTVEQHIQDGTYRKSRHENLGVKLDSVVELPVPDNLTDKAKANWNEIIPVLTEAGLISIVDYSELTDAFIQYGTAQSCLDYVNENFNSHAEYLASLNLCKGTVNQLNQYSVCMERYNKIMHKFGVTPYERGKIKMTKKTVDETEQTINALKTMKGKL